jgi:hypothetical protein
MWQSAQLYLIHRHELKNFVDLDAWDITTQLRPAWYVNLSVGAAFRF